MSFQEEFSGELPAIDRYGDGVFYVNEREFEGSILLWKDGVYPWDVDGMDSVTADNLAALLDHADELDIILFGTGVVSHMLPRAVRDELAARNIAYDVMNTGAAARTFNMLLVDGRRVAVALLAV
ncbi:MAG: hypothetical protein KAI28_11035 [Sphingomonadales bacterium]|nr:hypothetical protein [Sphingomonadales bacterium]